MAEERKRAGWKSVAIVLLMLLTVYLLGLGFIFLLYDMDKISTGTLLSVVGTVYWPLYELGERWHAFHRLLLWYADLWRWR